MKKYFILGMFLLSSLAGIPRAHGERQLTLTPEMRQQLQQDIQIIAGWSRAPIVIHAVQEQNAKEWPRTLIEQRDVEWIGNRKQKKRANTLMLSLLEHPASKYLRHQMLIYKKRYPEAFLCDNQGSLVAMSRITSDYWQGDEDKWTKAFNDAQGLVYVGEPGYDRSTKTIQVQVSVPVNIGNETIGVLVVGIRMSALKNKR